MYVADRRVKGRVVGSWLGALFTGVGLLAVVSQLYTVMRRFSVNLHHVILRESGEWSRCANEENLREGLCENTAPALLGWLQAHYRGDWTIKLTQRDQQTAGTSSRSKLFAQCDIKTEDLIKYGGSDALFYPIGSDTPRRPVLADIRFEEGKILYGFSSSEFAALIILCGLKPEKFSSDAASFDDAHLGIMHLTGHGPFTQIAHFDPHFDPWLGQKDMYESEPLVYQVPVKNCINLALGLLETNDIPDPRWIVLPNLQEGVVTDTKPYRAWRACPSAAQLEIIRYNLEHFPTISGADLTEYSTRSDDSSQELLAELQMLSTAQLGNMRCSEALLAARAIRSLRIWPLRPVVPEHVFKAFREILTPFVGSRTETVSFLRNEIKNFKSADPPSGWTSRDEFAKAIGYLGDFKIDCFTGSSAYCSWYFQGMSAVFRRRNLNMDRVRDALAIATSKHILESGGAELSTACVEALRRRIGPRFSEAREKNDDVPEWAVTIFATYIWG